MLSEFCSRQSGIICKGNSKTLGVGVLYLFYLGIEIKEMGVILSMYLKYSFLLGVACYLLCGKCLKAELD